MIEAKIKCKKHPVICNGQTGHSAGMIKDILEKHKAYSQELELDLLRHFETLRKEIFFALQNSGAVANETTNTGMDAISQQYYELLYSVEQKWPNESRHQTALRYIQQAERNSKCGGIAKQHHRLYVGRKKIKCQQKKQ